MICKSDISMSIITIIMIIKMCLYVALVKKRLDFFSQNGLFSICLVLFYFTNVLSKEVQRGKRNSPRSKSFFSQQRRHQHNLANFAPKSCHIRLGMKLSLNSQNQKKKGSSKRCAPHRIDLIPARQNLKYLS